MIPKLRILKPVEQIFSDPNEHLWVGDIFSPTRDVFGRADATPVVQPWLPFSGFWASFSSSNELMNLQTPSSWHVYQVYENPHV